MRQVLYKGLNNVDKNKTQMDLDYVRIINLKIEISFRHIDKAAG